MKKKLLITLGCSYTEGVGCYDIEEVKKFKEAGVNLINRTSASAHIFYETSRERFHKNSWGAYLQKFLNYDKFINLGMAATANSHHVKKFIEEFGDTNLNDEYDVVVIWLMTFAGRISFYSGGAVKSVMTNGWRTEEESCANLRNSYVNFVQDINHDTALEQIFYLRVMKEICVSKGYKFFFANVDAVSNNIIEHLYPQKENLTTYYKQKNSCDILYLLQEEKYQSPIKCHHPNELGYEFLAKKLFEIFESNFSYLVNKNLVINHENEFRGNNKKWLD